MLTAVPSSNGGWSARSRSWPDPRSPVRRGSPLRRQQRPNDVDAFTKPLRPDLLARPAGPVMCSFAASPVPSATQKRPWNMAASVAIACATIAGWYRCPGALTTPNGSEVRARPRPAMTTQTPSVPAGRSMARSGPSSSLRRTQPARRAGRHPTGPSDRSARARRVSRQQAWISSIEVRADPTGWGACELTCRSWPGSTDLVEGSTSRAAAGRARTRRRRCGSRRRRSPHPTVPDRPATLVAADDQLVVAVAPG